MKKKGKLNDCSQGKCIQCGKPIKKCKLVNGKCPTCAGKS